MARQRLGPHRVDTTVTLLHSRLPNHYQLRLVFPVLKDLIDNVRPVNGVSENLVPFFLTEGHTVCVL
jgi:hypothetical protein